MNRRTPRNIRSNPAIKWGIIERQSRAAAMQLRAHTKGVARRTVQQSGTAVSRASPTCRHLQQAVAFRIQGSLELEHVVVLLGVHELVREKNIQPIEVEPHGWRLQLQRAGWPLCPASTATPTRSGVLAVLYGGIEQIEFWWTKQVTGMVPLFDAACDLLLFTTIYPENEWMTRRNSRQRTKAV